MEDRDKQRIDVNNPTTKQFAVFTVLLSFIVSVVGTILTIGVLGPFTGAESAVGGAIFFNKPHSLERVTEVVHQTEVAERVLRQEDVIVEIVELSAQAVVGIRMGTLHSGPAEMQGFIDVGSGFLVSADGTVITGTAVVSDPEARYEIVFAGGRTATATVVKIDGTREIAVLKAEVSDAAHLSFSDVAARSGQTAIAIGRGGAAARTVAVGVVSGFLQIASSTRMVTDMRVEASSIGGPVLDLRGLVIGMLVPSLESGGSGTKAIPVSDIRDALAASQESDRGTGDF